MGKATPYRNTEGVIPYETLEKIAILIVEGSNFLDWVNQSPNLTTLVGEPIWFAGRVWLPTKTIEPGKIGRVHCDWVADFQLDPAHTGDILQGAGLWFKYDSAASNGVGYVVATAPSNGFFLGHAAYANLEPDVVVNGSGLAICAKTGSKRVRVVASRAQTALGVYS